MIPRYSDLAANERTYLAWMRTALALIAFGFLLERFDLLMRCFAKSVGGGVIPNTPARDLQLQQEIASMTASFGREAGILLAIVGLVILVLSTVRFTVTTRRIRSDTQEVYGFQSVLITGGIFILLALFVILYITRFQG
jgi:putative membrane protein